ncbi:MAG: MFS transporter [Oscillospiraceae bacterium]
MTKKENFFTKSRILRLIIIAISGSVIFEVPYLRYLYYDPLLEAVGLSNAQFGTTMSVFGIVSMLTYFPGGIIADKFSAKKLITFSLLGVALTGIWFSFFPGYATQLIIYSLWAIFISLVFWAAMNKAIRVTGDSSEQGRLFGLIEGGRGLFPMLYGFVVLAIFNALGANTFGLVWVIRSYSILSAIGAILVWIFLEDVDDVKEVSENKASTEKGNAIRNMIAVLKQPSVWMIAIIIFSSFVVYAGQSYITPYLSEMFGASVSLVAALGLIRTYGLAIGGGPLSGVFADKVKSSTKVLIACFAIIAVMLAVFLLVPANPSLIVVVVVAMIIMGFFVFATRGIYFATVDEACIPMELTGSAVGFASFIGFIPDAFIYTLFGSWMDKHPGAEGYELIFKFMIIFAILGFLASLALIRMIKKNKERRNVKNG